MSEVYLLRYSDARHVGYWISIESRYSECRRDVPVGVPLDLSTPTGMSCIGTYGENCKSDNVSKYRVLLLAFLLLWHENWCHGKIQ